MRDPSASVESRVAPPSSTFPRPDAPPAGGVPTRPDKAKSVSGVMLAVGIVFLLFVPLGGALFLVAGGLGLAIASEAPVGDSSSAPSVTANAATTPIQPQPSSATKQ